LKNHLATLGKVDAAARRTRREHSGRWQSTVSFVYVTDVCHEFLDDRADTAVGREDVALRTLWEALDRQHRERLYQIARMRP
jgi:hypothetical protein